MIKKIFLFLSICIFFCTGCFNYRDSNRAIFVTCVIFDINEGGEIEVYVEAFHSFRSYLDNTEQGQRLVFNDTGTTIFKVLRQLNQASKYKIDYTQNKAILFTEKAAKEGIGDFLDFLQRDQEFLLRPFLAILLEEPVEFLSMPLLQDEFIGLYLYELFQDRLLSSGLLHFRFNDFLNHRLLGKHIYIVNALELDKQKVKPYIKIGGGAILENDIMVDLMMPDKVVGFNFITDNIQSGAIEIPHPQKENKPMSLEIRESKTKTDFTIEDGRIKMYKDVTVDVVIAEAQGGLKWARPELKLIETYGEQAIKTMMEECYAHHKHKGLDIYAIQENIERKFPESDIENAIMITDMIVNVKVHILGSTDIQGSK